MRVPLRAHTLGLGLAAALALAATSDYGVLTGRDWVDPRTGRAAEIIPGAPFVAPGPDGWDEPVIDPAVVGDEDLVVRTGTTSLPRLAIPAPSLLRGVQPRAVAEPLGEGARIAFSAMGASAHPLWPNGSPLVPYGVRTWAELEGRHVAVVAFADLDGDGYVGLTRLDGDAGDDEIEEAELVPVGKHLFIGIGGAVQGWLSVAVGGPTGAPLRVAVAAGAYLGDFDPGYMDGALPNGPAVFTHLPFHPVTDPSQILGGYVEPPNPANPLELLGVDVRVGLEPDPGDPRYGEAYTLRLDGSDRTVDTADVHSGAPAGFAIARTPDPGARYDTEDLKLRPALDPTGARTLYELPRHAVLRSASLAGGEAVRLVPVDRLGNVADLAAPATVAVRATGWLRIAAPDVDGDPSFEPVVVDDARGAPLLLRVGGLGRAAPARQHLLVEAGDGGLSAVEVLLPGTPDPFRSNRP